MSTGTVGFLSPDELARVVARWPSADAFYDERDDRTRRSIGELVEFAVRPIEIWVDPLAAGDVTVQRVTLVAANLTSRWARHVRVVLPDSVPLAAPLHRDGTRTLNARVLREMTLADPFGAYALTSRGTKDSCATEDPPLRLFIGPWSVAAQAAAGGGPTDDDYRVHAHWWSVLGARGRDEIAQADAAATVIGWPPASVPATGLAGALGAADLFKRAAGHPAAHWLQSFMWDMWTHTLVLGAEGWSRIAKHPVPEAIDLGRTLLAGVGAIGSAFVYLADLAPLTGTITIFDRDRIETTNLNRAPLFTVLHALDEPEKSRAVAAYLSGRGVAVTAVTGLWRAYATMFAREPFDVWVSLTNEDGAWAEVPFALPPVVLHGTTTSGWGFGAGRHVPRRDDCTLCRMPRPQAEFRGPCALGDIRPTANADTSDDGKSGSEPPRASLPFLSTAAAALVLGERMKLDAGRSVLALPNDIAADLGVGLPAVIALMRGPSPECRGCRATQSVAWTRRLGTGRYDAYS